MEAEINAALAADNPLAERNRAGIFNFALFALASHFSHRLFDKNIDID